MTLSYQYMLVETLNTRLDSGQVLESDARGVKVIQLTDSRIMKIFRVRNTFSSAWLIPYSRRFYSNTLALSSRGIIAPTVTALYHLPDPGVTAVDYTPIPGSTLHAALQETQSKFDLCDSLGRFLANLHALGIYFRSIHFNNIIVSGDGEIGLIDVADMSIKSSPLRLTSVKRNMKHFFRREDDVSLLSKHHHEVFINSYSEHSSLAQHSLNKLRSWLLKSPYYFG